MSTPMSEPMQRLSEALDAERQALVAHDVYALIRATGAKLDALRALDKALPVGQSSELQELAERNRANGVLLSRRRREVNWALRQLGRSEDAPAYDSKGQSQQMTAGRPLAVA
ncbi:flagellar protein FlgN [Stenotrophomonas sp. SORGH_AS_0321]|uniref:flagellar protein FlgN n=1 Tax=Stenotrophomonas sp. SORGH_AS_0321 TaxID=3041787 RepID=UPI00286BE9DD|nr:flagellar protein FlgN [Stenotrophomonas sp. SORGH_AS_0321]